MVVIVKYLKVYLKAFYFRNGKCHQPYTKPSWRSYEVHVPNAAFMSIGNGCMHVFIESKATMTLSKAKNFNGKMLLSLCSQKFLQNPI